jgi:hypothetical protein
MTFSFLAIRIKYLCAMKAWMHKSWLAALTLFPFVLWVLPAGFFDSTGMELCPSRYFFDIECFGCGITRAVMHLHHLDWREAVYYNNLVVVVYPALVVTWFIWWRSAWKKVSNQRQVTST